MEEKNKNGFSKVLTIIFTIFSVILCNVAFKNERVIAGIIALVMTGAFIVTYLMKANVIKEPKKGINTILYIIAILLIIPYFNTYSKSQNETEKIIWSDIVMGEVLPEPKEKQGQIRSNSETYLSVDISKASKEDYLNYIEDCKGKGFTVEAEKTTNSYDAYNQEGYKLRINYWESSEKYDIALNAPMQMKENSWPNNEISQLIPPPKSTLGKTETESSKGFTYYVGKTSKEDLAAYADSLLEAGFSKDYQKGEEYFYGSNSAGYKVDIRYEGNSIMKIRLDAPSSGESKPTEEPVAEPENEPVPTETAATNNTGISKEFKDAMDSYETFIDQYVAFMKKYAKSNGTDLSLITDYTNYVTQYGEMVRDFSKWEVSGLNTAETNYYIEVQTRVSKKLLEVTQ